MTYVNPNEITKKLFDLLLCKYQIGLETQMRLIDFVFDYVELFCYKLHKIHFKRGGSYIDSSD